MSSNVVVVVVKFVFVSQWLLIGSDAYLLKEKDNSLSNDNFNLWEDGLANDRAAPRTTQFPIVR